MSTDDVREIATAIAERLRYCERMGVTSVPRGARAATEVQPTSAPTLDEIRANIGDCTRCGLCAGRTQIVFGVGNPKARLMFVGEAPGADEDAKGEPFVGRAGQLLNKIIEAMGLRRDDVYIGNVVKCRPPDNRAPLPDEAATCMPFLHQQIAAIQPEIIVCLGSIATRYLLDNDDLKISRVRGHFQDWRGIQIMPTYHPAYLLRNPAAKKEVWEDMQLVMGRLGAGPT